MITYDKQLLALNTLCPIRAQSTHVRKFWHRSPTHVKVIILQHRLNTEEGGFFKGALFSGVACIQQQQQKHIRVNEPLWSSKCFNTPNLDQLLDF